MGNWEKSFWLSGGYGIILGLARATLMIFGVSQAHTLWITSIALYLAAIAIIWIRLYQISHASDQEEKLETAMYAALEERAELAGSDLSSRNGHKIPPELDPATKLRQSAEEYDLEGR